MDLTNFEELIKTVVLGSKALKDKYTDEKSAEVNYAAVFCQSDDEYKMLIRVVGKIGKVIDNTPTGPLFHISRIDTVAGTLKLLKIRMPDAARKERGDADFTISDYERFKAKYLSRPQFRLIKREKFEMVELASKEFEVLAYFSNPPLDKQLGI